MTRTIPVVLLAAMVALLDARELQAADGTHLLVVEQSQIAYLDESGQAQQFIMGPGPARAIDGEVYVHRNGRVIVYDATGAQLRVIPVPPEVRYSIDFLVLPDHRLAFFDNQNDAVYFVDETGTHLKTVAVTDAPDRHLQNMDGVVVGEKLIVSENGHNELVAIDLSNYELSKLSDLTHLQGWLGAITYADGKYFVCQSRDIYSLDPESQELTKLATTPEANIVGIVAHEGRLFVVVNGVSSANGRSLVAKKRSAGGVVYEVDPQTGIATELATSLNYPDGILLLEVGDE